MLTSIIEINVNVFFGMGLKPKPSLHHIVFIHDTRVCVCVCMPFELCSIAVQQQHSAPVWIKVLLGCGCAPFGKIGIWI